MLLILNALLWCILVIAGVITFWSVVSILTLDEVNKVVTIGSIVAVIVSSILVSFTGMRIEIVEANAVIKSFEIVKEKKNELGDSYIIEPSVLTNYANALKVIEKYKNLGVE